MVNSDKFNLTDFTVWICLHTSRMLTQTWKWNDFHHGDDWFWRELDASSRSIIETTITTRKQTLYITCAYSECSRLPDSDH